MRAARTATSHMRLKQNLLISKHSMCSANFNDFAGEGTWLSVCRAILHRVERVNVVVVKVRVKASTRARDQMASLASALPSKKVDARSQPKTASLPTCCMLMILTAGNRELGAAPLTA